MQEKVLFSCTPARSCKILRDLVGSCGILQESCKNLAGFLCKDPARFLQNPTRSRKIPQDLARSCRGARKKDLFLQDLARAFLLGIYIYTCYYPKMLKNHTPFCLLLSFCTTEYLASITMNKMCGRPIILHLLICLFYLL